MANFREYTINPVTGEPVTEPMDLSGTTYEVYVDLDTFLRPDGTSTVRYAYLDCYNVYHMPISSDTNFISNYYPKIYIDGFGDEPLRFGGYLDPYGTPNAMILESGKYYVSKVCAMEPDELVRQLNSGNYYLSNMPGAIWIDSAYYSSENPTTARIVGGHTYYSTIGLSAYIKYLSKYFGEASYTPLGDKIPKYSMDSVNGRVGIIQSNSATTWTNRQPKDVLTMNDLGSLSEHKIPTYNANGQLISSDSNEEPSAVIVWGQTSNTAVNKKIAIYDNDTIHTNVDTADKVNHALTLIPNEGATSSSSATFDGENTINVTITKDFVGLGEVENYSITDMPLYGEQGDEGNTQLLTYFQQKHLSGKIDDATTHGIVVVTDSNGDITKSSVTTAQLLLLSDFDPDDESLISTASSGQPNGFCPLGADGKIPFEYLNTKSTKLMGEFTVRKDPLDNLYYAYVDLDGVSTKLVSNTDLVSTPFENGEVWLGSSTINGVIDVNGIVSGETVKVQSGDKIYVLVEEDTTTHTYDVTLVLQRESDLVSSVAGRIGAVKIGASDIHYTYDETSADYSKTLDPSWTEHTYTSVKQDIDSKVSTSQAELGNTHSNTIMVTNTSGSIVPDDTVSTDELHLLSGHSSALIDASDTAVGGSISSANKVFKLNSNGLIDSSKMERSSRISAINLNGVEVITDSNGDWECNISKNSLISDYNLTSATIGSWDSNTLFHALSGNSDWNSLIIGSGVTIAMTASNGEFSGIQLSGSSSQVLSTFIIDALILIFAL